MCQIRRVHDLRKKGRSSTRGVPNAKRRTDNQSPNKSLLPNQITRYQSLCDQSPRDQAEDPTRTSFVKSASSKTKARHILTQHPESETPIVVGTVATSVNNPTPSPVVNPPNLSSIEKKRKHGPMFLQRSSVKSGESTAD
mmetsp:Transcript_4846/g.7396  ORF Transcript_4846/g.7396 Transcript_4846/m.7396 type:complete len:140 (+) Transcript_4846:1107-1526(+)